MLTEQTYKQPHSTLRWFDDETFYSVCSRQHYFLGNLDAASTCAWLFGSRTAGTTHDLPFNLDALNGEARSSWGDPTAIIYQHTILPFFFPFQSPARVAETIETLLSPRMGSLKYRLGLLTGRFGAEHPLKACTACMNFDRENHGVAYWHLSHQYPGVVVCPVHHIPLRESKKNRQWSGRFQWFLPEDNVLSQDNLTALPINDQRELENLANAVLELATHGSSKSFKQEIVRLVYRKALDDYCLSRPDQESAVASFARHASRLQPYPPLTALPVTTFGAATLLEQITRSPRGHSHPLKHLAVITWLFGTLNSFVDAYDRLENLNAAYSRAPSNLKELKLVRLSETCPASQIVRRRPKILRREVRLSILTRLKNGEEKASICNDFSITISTLNKLLRSEPLIQKLWTTQHKLSQQSQRRSLWLSTVKSFPNFGTKRIRSMIPEIYAWLYRNDRQWLAVQTKTLPIERKGNYSKVDWRSRDKKLLSSIKSTLKIKSGEKPPILISKEHLNLLIPCLSRALEKIDKYPLTRQLVHEITDKPPSNRKQ